jgi:hypothetical protein
MSSRGFLLPNLLAMMVAVGPAVAVENSISPEATPILQVPGRVDPIHRLVELDSRTRIKPDDLLKSSTGEYPSGRLVFRDTATGNVMWKMTHNPGYNRHQYSNVLEWNIDGSKMLLTSTRPAGRTWLVTPDGSRWTYFGNETSGVTYWSPVDPNKLYFDRPPTREIFESDLSSGQTRRLWDLSADHWEFKLFRPSTDAKKFLVRERGIPVQETTHSFALLLNADGTGQPQRIDLGCEADQMWFTKRNDYSFIYDVTGQIPGQWLCEPGKNGAVRLLSTSRFYHLGVSPAGNRAAFVRAGESGLWIGDLDTGVLQLCLPYDAGAIQAGGRHQSWECDDRWLVASIGNGIYEVQVNEHRSRLICVPNTRHLILAESEPQSSPDGTKFGYNSTMLGDCDSYVAVQRLPDPPRNVQRHGRILTWDPPERCRELAGYGIYRGTELLNREPTHARRYEVPEDGGQYTVVAVEHSGLQSKGPYREPPPAPAGLTTIARTPFVVELTWQPSTSPDVSYYNVYCSSQAQSAAAQENRVASPNEPRLIDWGLQAGAQYHYALTAVDRSGHESAASSEVAVHTPPIHRVLQQIPVGKPLGETPLSVSLDVPQDDRYLLWIELKTGQVRSDAPLRAGLDEGHSAFTHVMWDFVSTGHDTPAPTPFFDTLKSDGKCDPWYSLKAGPHHLNVSLPSGSAEIVSLILTNDAGFVPEGISRFRHEPQP